MDTGFSFLLFFSSLYFSFSFGYIPKAEETKANRVKCLTKYSCLTKETISRMKRQPPKGKQNT